MVGLRFFRLLILSLAYKKRRGRGWEYYWKCLCDCGKITIKAGIYLRIGDTKSCGCLVGDRCAARNYKHGFSHNHRLYLTWKMMRARCNNPNFPSYVNYGARGIKVCKRWDNFLLFLEDMGPTWREGLTLNRIDNNGPYSPENCCWATDEEQANNSRRNHHLTLNGKTQTISRWAREIGESTHFIHNRLKRGWSIVDTLTTPKLDPHRKRS